MDSGFPILEVCRPFDVIEPLRIGAALSKRGK